ncbi:hypothetical protein NMG60_11028307 [Bertholletia excelsa]
MEESLASSTAATARSPPYGESPASKHQNGSTESPRSTPVPSSVIRLWRPAAQRNVRNQWSKLASYKQQWTSSSSSARQHATSVVNSYLSQRYMNSMELGALSDMPDIKKKAAWKLFKQQEMHQSKLLSSYKDMVAIVMHMVNASRSMRSYLKGAGSPLVQFSNFSEDNSDSGDGGGIPVYTFWSVSSFEQLAQELVQMFTLELNLKRLLVVELLSINSQEDLISNGVCWLDELYPGESDDLCVCGLYSKEVCEPLEPKLRDRDSKVPVEQPNHKPEAEVLQVYLTAWLAEVNIDMYRVEEIFAVVGEEMHVSLC